MHGLYLKQATRRFSVVHLLLRWINRRYPFSSIDTSLYKVCCFFRHQRSRADPSFQNVEILNPSVNLSLATRAIIYCRGGYPNTVGITPDSSRHTGFYRCAQPPSPAIFHFVLYFPRIATFPSLHNHLGTQCRMSGNTVSAIFRHFLPLGNDSGSI